MCCILRTNKIFQDDLQQAAGEENINEKFIKAEQEHYYEKQNGFKKEENIYENVGHQINKTDIIEKSDQYIDMTVTASSPEIKDDEPSAVYEDIDDDIPIKEKPNLILTDLCDDIKQNENEMKSVKDRMLLSTDVAPCLLFTQTVTSPMLTPSEENIDFLKGFRRESTEESKDENIYENAEFLKNQSNTTIYENLKDNIEENIYENLKDVNGQDSEEVIYQNVEELKEENIEEINQIESEEVRVKLGSKQVSKFSVFEACCINEIN